MAEKLKYNQNPYLPTPHKILEIIAETDIDYTYRVAYDREIVGGQFVEVTVPTQGECPISVSGIGPNSIDLTIRHIGKVTNEIKKLVPGDVLYLRGPYGNGFDIESYRGKHLVVTAGGTGLAPVRSLVEYYVAHADELTRLDIVIGFKTPKDILFKDQVEEWRKNKKINIILTVDKNDEEFECSTGFITEHVKKIALADLENLAVVIVGPPIMMSCTAREFQLLGVTNDKIWVSFERNMSCGLGKCGHCKIDETYVCLEGPVFRMDAARNLLD